jgi:hypothetical protein
MLPERATGVNGYVRPVIAVLRTRIEERSRTGFCTWGRPSARDRLPLRDMVFAACFNVCSTVSCRRFLSDLDDAHAKGYLSRVSHFNSIFKYLELPTFTPVLRDLIETSSLPMKAIEMRFTVDSTGSSTSCFVRWYDAKYRREMEQHDWLKAHVICGVTTNIVTSVEITGAYGLCTIIDACTKIAEAAQKFAVRLCENGQGHGMGRTTEIIDA